VLGRPAAFSATAAFNGPDIAPAASFLLVIVRHLPEGGSDAVDLIAPSRKEKLRLYSALFSGAIGENPTHEPGHFQSGPENGSADNR
jgi:hypothetical protein